MATVTFYTKKWQKIEKSYHSCGIMITGKYPIFSITYVYIKSIYIIYDA